MNQEFKPYIPADKVTPEITPTSVIMGVILAVVFGAANAYLGLRVGLTITASIPAAVISMAVIRIILKRDSILENNMVQTIGSAGESLAGGSIFTMPALFLWAKEGVMDTPSLVTITIIALFGGLLGVFFMVPLRNALIVQEHGVLPYPEGTACAEVLLAGEKSGSGAGVVFAGIGISAAVKFVVDGLGLASGSLALKVQTLKTEFGTQIYPALISVGYVCGLRVSSFIFAGGLISWFVLIPAIAIFGGDMIMYPGTDTIAEIYNADGASGIWSNYIKYIGAGAVGTAGIISLVKTMPLIVRTFVGAINGLRNPNGAGTLRTDLDLDIRIVIGGIVAVIVGIGLVPGIPVTFVGALIIVVFGFFFCAVSSRMVGLVGSSNTPVSGMTVATLLIATITLKITGDTGAHGMQGAIAIGSVICIATAMAADTSQDLKTGYLLGATPRKQQIGEIIGVFVSALAIGGVMILLDDAYTFGSDDLSAPQATMMKMIIEGVMEGNLPWSLIFIGSAVAVTIEVLGISALPVAIGVYLPLELTTPIMIGGLIRFFADRITAGNSEKSSEGVLFCSGMIAGEGLVGILLAVLAVFNISRKINLGYIFGENTFIPEITGLIILLAMAAMLFMIATKGNRHEKQR